MQLATVGPPHLLALVDVGFSVSHVATAHGTFPEAAHELGAGQIAPAPVDIAFITGFVAHHGLAVSSLPVGGAFSSTSYVHTLDGTVGAPRLVVVVNRNAVVNGAQMAECIISHDHASVVAPVFQRFVGQQIVFVSQ